MPVSRKTKRAAQNYHVLRNEVQNMPMGMASAMLTSLTRQTIVTGQYTDSRGGACPLLAAWRAGAVKLEHSFPMSWDVFCGLKNPKQARKCTPHEVGILRMLLEERLFPLGERSAPMSSPQPAAPAAAPSFTVVARSPEKTPELDSLEWSCDWEDELAELYAGSSNVATITRPTTSFIRARQVDATKIMDVGSTEWAKNLGQLLSL